MPPDTGGSRRRFNADVVSANVNRMGSLAVPCSVAKPSVADEELMRALYAEYGGPLLRYVTGLTAGDRQHAEDIVQETLLRAWRHPEVLQSSDRTPRAWLFAVARNLAIDAYRARVARPQEQEEVPELAVDDQRLDAALTHFELLEAMQGLAAQHREVIVAVYYRGLSVEEAAQLLGVPAGTVKSRCHYALRALRVLCEERGLLP